MEELKKQIQDLSWRFMELESFQQKRQEALEKMEMLSLPTYERMPITEWNLTTFQPVGTFFEDERVYDFAQMDDGLLMVQEEDETIIEQIPQQWIEKGVIFADWSTIMSMYPELVEHMHFSTEDKLLAYHTAMVNGGVVLYVPKGVVIDIPVEMKWLQRADSSQSFVKHVCIIADEMSEVTYVEHIENDGVGQVRSANIVMEVLAKAGAKVQVVTTDKIAKNTTAFIKRQATVERDAEVNFNGAELNEGRTLVDLSVDLVGSGACGKQVIAGISQGTDQFVNTTINQMAKATEGQIIQRGIAKDSATMTFNGIGYIHKYASQAKTRQESRLLLTSDNARGDANPILLIDHDDVEASHAASIGYLDQKVAFYLMSRGLDEKTVQYMQMKAFLSPLFKEVKQPALRQQLMDEVERKLTSC